MRDPFLFLKFFCGLHSCYLWWLVKRNKRKAIVVPVTLLSEVVFLLFLVHAQVPYL
jgi:drug/metabolite transporter superfamily protein YnfA